MENSYIAIYENALDKSKFAALRSQVAPGAFIRLSGWRAECVLRVYKFAYERNGQRYAAYLIRGEEARMLIELALSPEHVVDGSRETLETFNKLEEAFSIFHTVSECIHEANYMFEAHAKTMEDEIGFAYPAYSQSVLQQIDHALPHAEAHLRSHLLAQFDRLGLNQ